MTEQKKTEGVGYRRPPRHSQFKPGQSGNPKGRPKGTVNLRSDLREELGEHIRVREGERELKVSKQRAMLKALVSKALKGDARAAHIVLTLVEKLFEPEAAKDTVPDLTSEDQAILERFLARRVSGQPLSTEE
ncbi:hypothetical protein NB311A_08717 [Nitrobacter sp. Nb-311A]|uniref:DUF5681 domain-containing protein n=1 Tax=Nitrobacter sp. Nb-311A TaxID=314253 RepID=UPI0000684AD5|nr:DUF5681 domain-containing protein [Nitrobacter sp. Nb-311A]EAQ33375.1 hypothetical protein NB311A_06733 [Nitrobacter sp. Nb-311A]EAQ33445.1 hypothetical protein NB311A_08717 [Nitrobacter sp. Nb-311A]